MAKIVRCDRCGALEPENSGYDISLKPQTIMTLLGGSVEGDLCYKCAADFKAFMRNEDVPRRYNVVLKKEETK